MAREFSRTERVADYLQRELATLIQRELRDPRLGMVSVTAVKVSRDLSYARVYCTVLDCDDERRRRPAPACSTVRRVSCAVRWRAACNCGWCRSCKFVFDASVGRGRDMEALISRAKAADAALLGSEDASDGSDGDGENAGDGA
jgi:ribosome-binding factor A